MRVKNLANVNIEAVLRKVDAMPKTQRAYAQIVRSLESGLKANPEHVKALRTTADAQVLAANWTRPRSPIDGPWQFDLMMSWRHVDWL